MIIDLGSPPAAEPDVEMSRPLPPYWRKLLAAVVAALACVPLLTTASLPEPSPVQFLAFLPGNSTEGLLMHQGVIVLSDGLGMTGYAPDGTKRWHIAGDASASRMQPQPAEHLLVLSGERPGTGGAVPYSIAIDLITGERVWSSDSYVTVFGGYLAALRDDQSVEVFEISTLKRVFSLPSQRAVALDVFHAAKPAIVALGVDGLLRTYEVPSGAPAHEPVRIDVPASQDVYLNPGADKIVLELMDRQDGGNETWPGPLSRMAVDRGTLNVSYDQAEQNQSYERDCGPVICVQSFANQGASVEVLSRDGQTRWPVPQDGWVEWRHDRLFRTGHPGDLAVVDPANGSVLVNLAGWEIVYSGWPGGVGGPALLAQRGLTGTRLARLGERGLLPIGSIPLLPNECTYESPFLACTTQDGQIGVWRVAPAR